jgi:hypothetical protein
VGPINARNGSTSRAPSFRSIAVRLLRARRTRPGAGGGREARRASRRGFAGDRLQILESHSGRKVAIRIIFLQCRSRPRDRSTNRLCQRCVAGDRDPAVVSAEQARFTVENLHNGRLVEIPGNHMDDVSWQRRLDRGSRDCTVRPGDRVVGAQLGATRMSLLRLLDRRSRHILMERRPVYVGP